MATTMLNTDWRHEIELGPDPYVASGERWTGALPAHVDWSRLDDRLIARGWYPKNAIAWLRVYGTLDGHEVVIEPSSRRVVFRVTCDRDTDTATCARIVDLLALTLAEEALVPRA